MKTNEEIVVDYILEKNVQAVNAAWITWALELIKDANKKKVTINPEWLRADVIFLDDSEPAMFIRRIKK